MSSFINKAKDKLTEALDKNNNKNDNPRSDNYGSHSSNYMNQADPTIDSDLDNRNNPNSRVGGYGNTQANDQYGTTQGAGGFASSDTYGSNTNNPGYDNSRTTNTGPHSSNLMNKADPRVDSDRDHRNDPTSRTGGYGNTQQYNDNYGQTGGAGGLGTTDTGYGRTTGGNTGYADDTSTGFSSGHGGLAANTTTGTTGVGRHNESSGYSNPSDTYDNSRSTNTGPHGNNLMNKIDPRVDSDNDNRNNPTSRVGGYGGQTDNFGRNEDYSSTTGTTGGYGHNTAGHFSSTTGTTGRYEDTGIGGTERYGETNTGISGGYDDSEYTPGSGNTKKTAGPHNSNLMNKLDPRVDSDMDSSKTYGGNATYR